MGETVREFELSQVEYRCYKLMSFHTKCVLTIVFLTYTLQANKYLYTNLLKQQNCEEHLSLSLSAGHEKISQFSNLKCSARLVWPNFGHWLIYFLTPWYMFYNFSQTVQCYIKGFQTEMPFNLFTATTTEERFIICHLPVICQSFASYHEEGLYLDKRTQEFNNCNAMGYLAWQDNYGLLTTN